MADETSGEQGEEAAGPASEAPTSLGWGSRVLQVVSLLMILSAVAYLWVFARPAAKLTKSNHSKAWARSTCTGKGCHLAESDHEGRAPYTCEPCHGTNGAPAFSLETSGHKAGMKSCLDGCHKPHETVAVRWPDPDSCIACHRRQ